MHCVRQLLIHFFYIDGLYMQYMVINQYTSPSLHRTTGLYNISCSGSSLSWTKILSLLMVIPTHTHLHSRNLTYSYAYIFMYLLYNYSLLHIYICMYICVHFRTKLWEVCTATTSMYY